MSFLVKIIATIALLMLGIVLIGHDILILGLWKSGHLSGIEFQYYLLVPFAIVLMYYFAIRKRNNSINKDRSVVKQ